MSDDLIKVENLSKKFSRNLKKSLLYGLEDISKDIMLIKKRNDILRKTEFWALDDISFSVKKGESIGIIGSNGSGKTTLLKLMNGLMNPNKGRIKINGTIGALIALGTGFNPILTGRENARIASSVLGMSRKRINDKMDDIIEFSGIEKFIDSPVRTYSSGMLVRLGFAVATQLNPDILLVDEVLAVGDLSFAIKCQKKIYEYRKKGGTLFIVSHGLHNIRFHCSKVLWLEKSKMMDFGSNVNQICDRYEEYVQNNTQIKKGVQIQSQIILKNFSISKKVNSGEKFYFSIELDSKIECKNPIIHFSINDIKGESIISRYSNFDKFFSNFVRGKNILSFELDSLPLKQGNYSITVVIGNEDINNQLYHAQNTFHFKVVNDKPDFGIIDIQPKWSIKN